MIIDAHTHIFDRSVGGAGENFPLWPGTPPLGRRCSRFDPANG